nr:MAG TPA: Phycobiliprotein ApcE, phycobilisome, phycocyanobilin attachment, TRANSFERASE [Caudoviricetes sp.]
MSIYDYDDEETYKVAVKVDKVLREHLSKEELEIVSAYLHTMNKFAEIAAAKEEKFAKEALDELFERVDKKHG